MNIFASDLRPSEYWHLEASKKLDIYATGKPEGYSTGFASIDWYNRMIPSELTIVAARPSMGKTSFAMQVVKSVAKEFTDEGETGCVAVFSAEMSGAALFLRMAAALCGVNTHKLRQGKGTKAEIAAMREAGASIRNSAIWIDDNSGPSTNQMLDQLSRINETLPVKMMLFDFLELGGDKAPKEDIRISQIVHNLKGIAKTLEIPVMALSQINRAVELRANKMPCLADLRYSGMIEQLADVVMFIMRPEYYVERGMGISDVEPEDLKDRAFVQIAKHRNGPVGLVKLAFEKERSRFLDLERRELNV